LALDIQGVKTWLSTALRDWFALDII